MEFKPKLTRRNFMKLAAAMGATAFLTTYKSDIVKAVNEAKDYWHINWINAAACTGCTVSFAQASEPDLVQILTEITVGNSGMPIALPDYMETVHPASGSLAESLKERWKNGTPGKRVLVVEGALQAEGFCTVAGKDMREHVKEAAEVADAIIAIGQCATFGGIPAAMPQNGQPNPTGAMGLSDFLKEVGIDKAVVNIPLCPVHPDHLVLTIAAVMIGAPLDLDEYGRPKAFFGKNMHDEMCPYRPYYDRGVFTRRPGEEGCRYVMGCKGPITKTDCALRKWNVHTSYCVQTNMCLGCSEPGWPDKFSPFYKPVAGLPAVLGVDFGTLGQGLLGAAAAGIVIHGVKRALTAGKKEEKKEE